MDQQNLQATIEKLHQLIKLFSKTDLENIPEAQPLLDAIETEVSRIGSSGGEADTGTQPEDFSPDVADLSQFPEENPNPILRLDLQGVILYANPASRSILEAWGCQVGQTAPPMWTERVDRAARLREKQALDCQVAGQWFNFKIVPIPGAAYVNLYGREITERKLSEIELESLLLENRRQAALLDGIFEADPGGLAVVVGPELRFVFVNPAYRYITPDPVQDPVGKPYHQVWPKKSQYGHRDRFGAVLRTGQPFMETGVEHHFPDGTRRSFTVQARRIIWEDQYAVLLAMWDTTDTDKTAQELRESQQRLKATQELAHLGSWELDLIQNRLTWSDEIYRIFGFAPQEFGATYEAFLEAVHPEERAAVDAAYSGSLRKNREGYEIEHRVVHRATGEVRFVHEKCVHIRDKSGQIIRSIGMVQDITEHKAAEQAVASSEARLLTLLESITDCCYTLDPHWRFTRINEPALAYFRKTRESLLGKVFWEVFPQALGTVIEHHYWQAVREQSPVHYEVLSPLTGLWVEVHAYPSSEGLLVILRDISGRKQMEDRLRESEGRYRSLFENMKDGYAYCQMIFENEAPQDFIYLGVNPAFEKLTGLQDVVGKKVTEVIPAIRQTNPELLEIYGRVARTGVPESFEVDLTPLSIWLSISVYRPQPGYFVAVFDNITERKRAEQALRESEARFRALADSNPLIIWVTNPDGELRYVNRTYQEFFGVSLEQVEGGKWQPLVHTEDAPAYLAAFQTALREKKSFRAQTRVRRADGVWRWIASFAEPRFSAEGEFLGFVGNSPDITERKQADERIRQLNQELAQRTAESEAERERWQGVVEGIADEVWVCDLDGKMSLINLDAVTGMGLLEFKNRTVDEVYEVVDILTIDGELRLPEQAPLLRSLKGEIVRGEEIMRHRQSGRTRYRQFSSAPMHDAAGKITGAVAIVRDITTLKQTEAEARSQAVKIELQRRLLAQREEERLLIARDLHDVPIQELTGVTFGLRGILMENCPPEIAQQLEAIQTTLQAQIDGLRSFAQELRPPTLTEFGLERTIRSHLESVRGKYPSLQMDFTCELGSARLPDDVRLALFRIYQESLTNSLKHSQASQVHVSAKRTEQQVWLEVQDNGVGFDIPQDWLELARHKHLGLVGMRERAEAVGGQVEIRSQKGAGTTVAVRVPLPSSSNPETAQSTPPGS